MQLTFKKIAEMNNKEFIKHKKDIDTFFKSQKKKSKNLRIFGLPVFILGIIGLSKDWPWGYFLVAGYLLTFIISYVRGDFRVLRYSFIVDTNIEIDNLKEEKKVKAKKKK